VLSFAAEFPVSASCRNADFIDVIKNWILGSPHVRFKSEDIQDIPLDKEWRHSDLNHYLETLIFSAGENDTAAVRFKITDAGIDWITDIVFSRVVSDAWVSVRTSRESAHPAISLPPAKKPIVVRALLEGLTAGNDGALLVRPEAHALTNNDIDLASKLIAGEAGCRLPIVYVSAGFSRKYSIDFSALAHDLAGLAHVVVEPNRPFSYRLKIEVSSQNVYGGDVGIYWPDGSARRSLFSDRFFEDRKSLKKSIGDEIRKSLLNRRPLYRCTWAAAQEAYSKRAIEYLQATGSIAVDKYIEAFDTEAKAKAIQLSDAEREIARLNAEIKRYEAQSASGSGGILQYGDERDFFDGELVEIVLSTLALTVNQLQSDGRRRHVIQSLIEKNSVGASLDARREKIKELLRDYRKMNSTIKGGLEDLGFSVTEDGKHYKLCYFDDDRYTFSLAKTGSDHRGGLNSASDISKRVF
jgi:hypothetical protein